MSPDHPCDLKRERLSVNRMVDHDPGSDIRSLTPGEPVQRKEEQPQVLQQQPCNTFNRETLLGQGYSRLVKSHD